MMKEPTASLGPEILAIFTDLRSALLAKRIQTAAEIEKHLRVAEQRLQGLLVPAISVVDSPLSEAAPSAPAAVPALPESAAPGGIAGSDRRILDLLPQAENLPDALLGALADGLASLSTTRDANELLSHLEASRRAGPAPPHPYYERLAELEAKTMEAGIRLAVRLEEALDFADTFWKHYGHQALTDKAFARAVEIARDIAECLHVARKARLRYEEVGIKEPGQRKPSSYRRKAPFGAVAQRAIDRARSLCRTTQDRQEVDQVVRHMEGEFRQLNLESDTSLR